MKSTVNHCYLMDRNRSVSLVVLCKFGLTFVALLCYAGNYYNNIVILYSTSTFVLRKVNYLIDFLYHFIH